VMDHLPITFQIVFNFYAGHRLLERFSLF
jgi:hypothetical protein